MKCIAQVGRLRGVVLHDPMHHRIQRRSAQIGHAVEYLAALLAETQECVREVVMDKWDKELMSIVDEER